MIRTYKFDYDFREASVEMRIDTEKLSPESAQHALEFFTWDWDKDGDVYDELAKKYGLQAIKFATFNGHNLFGVKSDFDEAEGFAPVDGKYGIELISVEAYEFIDSRLELK